MALPTPFDDNVIDRAACARVITKHSDHPLSGIILGTVVGMFYLDDSLILYYADGHAAAIRTDDEGNLEIGEHAVRLPC